MRRDTPNVRTGVLWGLGLSWWIVALIVNSEGVALWLSYVIAAGVVIAGAFVIRLCTRAAQRVALNRPCVHGVRAAKTGRCPVCAEEAQQSEQKQRISDEARSLYEREKHRLSNAWLSKSESYFNMDAQEFENAVCELFRKLGYRVEQTPFSNDRGKDAVIFKDETKYLIECKRYAETQNIGRRDLQIFVAAMLEEKASGGFYVNTGRFTSTAIEYALQNGIKIYDRARFRCLSMRHTRSRPMQLERMSCVKNAGLCCPCHWEPLERAETVMR